MNNKQYGPYTEIQVRAMVSASKIPANVQVYVQGGIHKWQPIQNFPKLLKPVNQKAINMAIDPSLFSAPIKEGYEIERTIWIGWPSSLTVIFNQFGKIFFVIILSILYRFFRTHFSGYAMMYFDIIMLLLFFVIFLKILWRLIELRCTKWTLTNERFNISTGVFSKNTSNLELYRIKDIQLRKPFLYKLFDYGYLDLVTSDKLNPVLDNIGAIRQQENILQLIRKYVERQKRIGPIKGIDVV